MFPARWNGRSTGRLHATGSIQSYCNTVPPPKAARMSGIAGRAILKGIPRLLRVGEQRKAKEIHPRGSDHRRFALVSCFIRRAGIVGQTKGPAGHGGSCASCRKFSARPFDNWLARIRNLQARSLISWLLRAEEPVCAAVRKKDPRKTAYEKSCVCRQTGGLHILGPARDRAVHRRGTRRVDHQEGTRPQDPSPACPCAGKILNVLGAASCQAGVNQENQAI